MNGMKVRSPDAVSASLKGSKRAVGSQPFRLKRLDSGPLVSVPLSQGQPRLRGAPAAAGGTCRRGFRISISRIMPRGIQYSFPVPRVSTTQSASIARNVPDTFTEAPLITPVVGGIGSGALAPRASRRNCTKQKAPCWGQFDLESDPAPLHPDTSSRAAEIPVANKPRRDAFIGATPLLSRARPENRQQTRRRSRFALSAVSRFLRDSRGSGDRHAMAIPAFSSLVSGRAFAGAGGGPAPTPAASRTPPRHKAGPHASERCLRRSSSQKNPCARRLPRCMT